MSTQEYIRSITELTPDEFTKSVPLVNENSSFSWQTWLIIILVLAFFGINVFAYLAKGTEETTSAFKHIFEPILAFFGYSIVETTKQTVDTSAKGTKAVTESVDHLIDKSISTNVSEEPKGYAPLRKSVTNATESVNTNNANQIDEWQQDSLERALNDASQRQNEPLPNDSIPTGKSGWCFIGEERGIRSCSEIGVNDMCMSGDIFPTQAVCMNPNLRA